MGHRHGKPELTEEDVTVLCQTSGLPEAEVRKEFQQFITDHPKGRIKRRELKKIMEKALPGEDAGKFEKHIFRVFDTNDDGSIDGVEFMLVFHIMKGGTPEESLARIFRVFDIDNNGVITGKEMKRVVKDMYKLVKAEAPEDATKEFLTNSTFAEMDVDGNGQVTQKEFIAACLVPKKFSQMFALKIIDIFLDD